ncbi:MAG: glycosyltransferase family 39 protein [Anaerolineales bacterium]|nr:MAG: glycosyltransferase family 39 protein [Anaerolineales bacterium]
MKQVGVNIINRISGSFLRNPGHGLVVLALLGFTAWSTLLRATSLGYSNFQGDEVAAQGYLFSNEGILQFLLTRSKGPLQYLLTYAVNGLVLGKVEYPEGFVRAPFLVAGILSIISIYLLGARYWSRRSGLVAAFLLAGSGLFLGFARIAQYQSFIVLLSILTYYEFLGYMQDEARWKLVAAGILSGVALLFHYDALSFILPITLFLVTRVRGSESWGTRLLLYLVPLILVSSAFYFPYVLNPQFRSTASYLLGQRISSEFRFDSIYYSLKLLTLYHPREFLLLLLLGVVWLVGSGIKSVGRATVVLVALLAGLIMLRILREERVDLLVYASTVLGVALTGRKLFWGRPKTNQEQIDTAMILWLLVSFTAYGLWFTMPLTHIYTFLIPFFVLLAATLRVALIRYPGVSLTLILIVGMSATSFNYQAFADVTPEYPWNSKTYLLGRMPDDLSKGELIEGIFGFPYNRDWREIALRLKQLRISTYATNEKYRLTRYYLEGFTLDENDYQVYVWVNRPQSFSRQKRPIQAPLFEGAHFAIFGR